MKWHPGQSRGAAKTREEVGISFRGHDKGQPAAENSVRKVKHKWDQEDDRTISIIFHGLMRIQGGCRPGYTVLWYRAGGAGLW
mmetsp:Transcript_73090/g.122435  ORF Transcript_73090/g.122435 Transcript_73090/m.122435 type:complete len:83 (+) Transcript_73090:133-381(+)